MNIFAVSTKGICPFKTNCLLARKQITCVDSMRCSYFRQGRLTFENLSGFSNLFMMIVWNVFKNFDHS